MSSENPIYGPFFGVMGAASAIIFSGMYSVWTINAEMAVSNRYRSLPTRSQDQTIQYMKTILDIPTTQKLYGSYGMNAASTYVGSILVILGALIIVR